ncbi:hypothetical protein Tco_1043069 [Tanacetum coccineum]|uniref:Xylulose kinase-1 n=1 Tax=Tanacetum coccineum TaxID=301880 RepID=A0ABQ5GLK8_9ASTR
MANLKFADTHNMVAFLSKPAESDGFEQIVDFLNAQPIRYALTVNPTIYISFIEQFWSTGVVKTINGEVQLHALIDGKKIIISEASVRKDLKLEDEEGIDCLPNSTIFEQLALMGYDKISQKLTFYKLFFSPQWKFLIHTILQCLSLKTTAWNKFSSTMASTIICLATNQKFNFPKFIFEGEGSTNLTDPHHTPTIIQPSTQPQKTQKPRKPKRKDTQVPQPSDPSDNVADEAIHKELGDCLVRAATTASRLEVEQDSGRMINAIDIDEDITLVNVQDDADNEMFDVNTLNVSTAATTVIINTEEITLAKALEALKTSKPKVKGIVLQEPGESTTTTTTVSSQGLSQDKWKGILVEPEKPLKKKDQLKLDEEIALKLQAKIDEEERIARAKEEKKLMKPILLGMTFKQKLILITSWLKDCKLKNKSNSQLKKKPHCLKNS